MHFPRSLALFLVVASPLASVARADEKPSSAKLGQKIDNVRFQDAAGKASALGDLKGTKATVVVFLSFDCPVSTSYAQPLADLAKAYGAKGVTFIGLCPCKEDAATVAKQAAEYKVPFPVFKEGAFAAADALAAGHTPEAFLLDSQLVLRYRGRIDDLYEARLKKRNTITRNDLKEALEEMLAGKDVGTPATQPIGCPILRPSTAKPATGKVTYYRDVLPILQNHCQACHRPGEVGPFALMSYRQAVNWAADIKEFTRTKRMPPWKPTDGVAFRDARTMSDQDIATLAAWVDGGTPEGNTQEAPPARKLPAGWQRGTPDLVLSVDADFQLGASGRDLFRCFVLPTNLDEDKYVTAVEVRPGNPRIVHHALNFIDTTGAGRKLEQAEKDRAKKDDEQDAGPGYTVQMGTGFRPSGAIGGWAPGQVSRRLPADTGYFLPKGSDVVVQVHYHRNGRVEKDRLQIGLYFADKPVAKRYQTLVLQGKFWFIPPGNEDYKVQGSVSVSQDATLYSVMPHMHMLGKSIAVKMTPPEGEARTIVAIKEWDYNWQETYFFKEPLAVKAGTKFEVEAHYDNSAKNPRNPFNPPRLVSIGEQTTNEMCFIFLGGTTDKGGRLTPAK
jgi:mono/diheme cytochrome c family protein/peroxiredoxin